jgi:hypothetical protein
MISRVPLIGPIRQTVRRIHRAVSADPPLTVHGVVFGIFVFGPQPIAQGTLKKPRNRTRPPRSGWPLTA